jgi:hypothetical protein
MSLRARRVNHGGVRDTDRTKREQAERGELGKNRCMPAKES